MKIRALRERASLAVLAVVAATLLAACGGGNDDDSADDLAAYPYPVQRFEDQGRTHFAPGTIYDQYNSNPPASGPHASVAAPWGVSDLAVPKETAIHNMEHAGVVVWYNCEGGPQRLTGEECAMLRNNLSSIVQQAIASGKYVLMTPYPAMTNRIALTAWTYLDAFDDFDATRVQAFIDTFVCRYDEENFCQ